MKRQLPSQTLEEQFLSPDTKRAPLSETIRLGAQLMLQKAVELEVTEFLGRDHYQRHGESLLQGYRNGYADKRVETGEGPLHLKMPQVRKPLGCVATLWLVVGTVVLREGRACQQVLSTLVWVARMPSWTAPAMESSLRRRAPGCSRRPIGASCCQRD
ncbi:MAG: transposase [Verrucomicrobiia bacterium]